MKSRLLIAIFLFSIFPIAGFAANIDSKTESASSTSANATLPVKLLEKLNFKEDTFPDKAKIAAVKFFENANDWRLKEKAVLEKSVEKVKESRKSAENSSTPIKAMSFLHLAALETILFIFTIEIIFYLVGLAALIFVIKKIFAILAWVFRSRAREG